MAEERFVALSHKTAADGWVEVGPLYQREDGTTFLVPPKKVHSVIGGDYVTYGEYSPAELKAFSDADKKACSGS
ncbi:hypothetical protein IK146_03515 [Candidatus Saccharibacteria bacterium]|nr:hypothetical protein [Candidatus Saccharibacteria bacterium]